MGIADIFRVAGAAIAATGSASLIMFALSSWLGKVWASRILERERGALAKELEERRAELARLTAEHSVRYVRLHERRATVISEVYARLEDFHRAVRALAILGHAPGARPALADALELARKNASQTHAELVRYFYRRGIWLDPETCDNIHEILQALSTASGNLSYHISGWDLGQDALDGISERLEVEIPRARRLLDRRFRSILATGTAHDGQVDAQT